jgi:metal-dependent hydrolase (beta-lactamase superfamily II)
MSRIENFGATQNVEVTVLVDNRSDSLLKSTDTVIRYSDKPLLAEHGFSSLINLKDAGVKILWDAGETRIALLENMRQMEIDPATIDKIALSHGHGDHFAAMTDVIKAVAERPSFRRWDKDATMEEIRTWVKGHKVPFIVHPAGRRGPHPFREPVSTGAGVLDHGGCPAPEF